jgi:outer membrane protein TolC
MRTAVFNSAFLAIGLLAASAPPVGAQVPYRLTLKEAIEKGLQNNLRVLVAGTLVDEAAGSRQRRLAKLLPRLRGEGLANVQTRSLRAFGITFPGAPDIVGPFSNYDLRAYVDQPLLDLPNYYRWKGSSRQEQAARLEYQDVRDLIIRQVAALYLNAQAAAARVEAAASRVTTAEELHRLAREQREAGVATGVDVLRAEVELANERQRLLEARNTAERALLVLARAIGLELGILLELAEPLDFRPVAAPEIPAAVASALDKRADFLSLQARHQALREEEKSNWARRLPRLSLGGNYGAIGRTPGEIRSTSTVQGTISIELFDWDRQGERMEIDSRRRRLDHQMADLRQGIEEEIRDALLRLESATEEVVVARQGRELAQRELELVRERFLAGVTSNIEVTSAQEAVARAQENHIVALTRHTDAKMALARALGATEEIYQHYLGIQ